MIEWIRAIRVLVQICIPYVFCPGDGGGGVAKSVKLQGQGAFLLNACPAKGLQTIHRSAGAHASPLIPGRPSTDIKSTSDVGGLVLSEHRY